MAEAATSRINYGDSGEVFGNLALRPVFLGNLHLDYNAEEVISIFETPIQPPNAVSRGVTYARMPVDRIDVKRGYCFIFLKDAKSQAEKEQAEDFVSDINGM
jgi:splicing factor, arginine/serine-rich 4/5/6